MNENEAVLAFIKYEGRLVADGYLDVRKSGEALVSIDEIMRYFIYQENPEMRGFQFEIPVRIRKGSWETIFPENIETYVVGFGLWMAGKYVGTALQELAKNDFKDETFKTVLKKSFQGMVQVIRLSKHLGTLSRKKFDKIQFAPNNDLIKITNDNGEDLWVPVEVLELYSNCPQTLFNNLTKIIEEERDLVVGFKENDILVEETITTKHKYIFTKTEEDVEIVLEELKHGDIVTLEGHITRGNEKSNTIGFLYKGHIITCSPKNGNIKQHKNKLFSNCLIRGVVDRLDKDGNLKEKRPRIIFYEIVGLDKPGLELFD